MADEAPQVIGYRTCRACGDPWVVDVNWKRCAGCCADCFLSGAAKSIATLEAEADGRRLKVRRKPIKRHGKQAPERVQAAERARRRAKTRLTQMYPDVYEVLLAQERIKDGLEPFPLERIWFSETFDLSALYHPEHSNGATG